MVKDAYELFGINLDKKKKKDKNNVLDNLYSRPKRDKGVNMPKFGPSKPGHTHQADILYLPDDNGYKYLLVVVDIGSRKVDAEPLKSKSSSSVLDAFKTIYDRKPLDPPTRLEIDPGAEFKAHVKKWFDDNKINVRVGKPGRHKQQAIVERMNYTIAKALFRRMSAQEVLTEEPSTEWVEDLPKLIKILNKKAKSFKQPVLPDKVLCQGNACKLLSIGDKVRVIQEEPRDYVSGKKLHGKFRATDLRWSPVIRTIKQVLLKPGSPPMYLLDGKIKGKEPVAYTRNELKLVGDNEVYPDGKKVIRGNPSKYKVERIIGKKKIKGKVYYNVKWKGYTKPTYEPKDTLIEDVPDMIADYESNN